MNWLIALLAFAGLMAVLSTIVLVLVEAVHKFLALRRAGLEEMLRALHDSVLRDVIEGGRPVEGGRTRGAAVFARTMTKNPAFGGGGRWWWPRNWPVLGILFQPHFEKLTTLQFVEQLGQTQEGKEIARGNRDRIRRAVRTIAFQFERYGDAQSGYFRRRAKVISTATAFAFVMLANIDAIAIYNHLANSQRAQDTALAFLRTVDMSALRSQAEAADRNIATLTTDPSSAQSASSTSEQVEELNTAIRRSLESATALAQQGLPIGAEYFPFCASPGGYRDAASLAGTRELLCHPNLKVTTHVLSWEVTHKADTFWARLLTTDGAIWLISIIATTGLIGLGAPFWFDLFARLASIVGGRRVNEAVERGRAAAAQAQQPLSTRSVRDAAAVDVESLTDALITATGRPSNGAPPRGRRAGRATADVLGVFVPNSRDAPLSAAPMRQLRD